MNDVTSVPSSMTSTMIFVRPGAVFSKTISDRDVLANRGGIGGSKYIDNDFIM